MAIRAGVGSWGRSAKVPTELREERVTVVLTLCGVMEISPESRTPMTSCTQERKYVSDGVFMHSMCLTVRPSHGTLSLSWGLL